MAYVVTGTCLGCKCGSCAEMCPVEKPLDQEFLETYAGGVLKAVELMIEWYQA